MKKVEKIIVSLIPLLVLIGGVMFVGFRRDALKLVLLTAPLI